MALRRIVGVVIETEADDEEEVTVAIETDLDAYLVAPPEMAEELIELMGHRVQASGTVAEEEDGQPVIDIEEYGLLYDEDEEDDEDEGDSEIDDLHEIDDDE